MRGLSPPEQPWMHTGHTQWRTPGTRTVEIPFDITLLICCMPVRVTWLQVFLPAKCCDLHAQTLECLSCCPFVSVTLCPFIVWLLFHFFFLGKVISLSLSLCDFLSFGDFFGLFVSQSPFFYWSLSCALILSLCQAALVRRL